MKIIIEEEWKNRYFIKKIAFKIPDFIPIDKIWEEISNHLDDLFTKNLDDKILKSNTIKELLWYQKNK